MSQPPVELTWIGYFNWWTLAATFPLKRVKMRGGGGEKGRRRETVLRGRRKNRHSLTHFSPNETNIPGDPVLHLALCAYTLEPSQRTGIFKPEIIVYRFEEKEMFSIFKAQHVFLSKSSFWLTKRRAGSWVQVHAMQKYTLTSNRCGALSYSLWTNELEDTKILSFLWQLEPSDYRTHLVFVLMAMWAKKKWEGRPT